MMRNSLISKRLLFSRLFLSGNQTFIIGRSLLPSFMSGRNEPLRINGFASFHVQRWKQEQEAKNADENRLFYKALYAGNELSASGRTAQLVELLTHILEAHASTQSSEFLYELQEIDSNELESFIPLVQSTNGAIPVHKAYYSLSELMSMVGRLAESRYFIEKALESMKQLSQLTNKDRAQNAQYLLKNATFLTDRQKRTKAYRAYLQEIGPNINRSNGHLIANVYYELAGDKIENNQIKESIVDLEKAFSICEGYYGWMDSLTSRIAVPLARIYLSENRIDFGIILAEKALIGFELFPSMFDLEELALTGIYLARAYEKKKFFPYQQATITRTYNLMKKYKTNENEQIYREYIFRLENMLANSKYVQGDLATAYAILKKLNDLTKDESFMSKWKERDEVEATLEFAFLKYFTGVTLVSSGDIFTGIEQLEASKATFESLGRDDWVKRVEENITEANEQVKKSMPPISHSISDRN
jgi:tetratricopeptide (TPR) repeat protein